MSGARPAESERLLLEPEFLRRLEALALVSRRLHRGAGRGEHPVLRRGSSLEFRDYRSYQPGDDIRAVDWNLYGRLDRLFVKVFAAEEDLTVSLLLDSSASMGVGGKLDYARRVAAALGYIGIAGLDRVGATAFSDRLHPDLPPRRSRHHLFALFRYLGRLAAGGATRFNACLQAFARRARRPGLAVVVSDLLDPQGFEEGLNALLYRKFDLVLIQVLAEEDIEPPPEGDLRLQDAETGQVRLVVVDRRLREHYRAALERLFARTERFCLERRIEYLRAGTLVPFQDLILRYLVQGMHLR